MQLLIGTTLICMAVLWLTVLLIGGRNPRPPWWANDWMLGDVQVPSLMLLVVIGIWFMTRFMGGHSPGAALGAVEILTAAGVVAITVLIIKQMKVGRRLRQFAEMEADGPPEESSTAESARMIYLHRKLPWQVRLHLADNMGYDLAWIRTLRCAVQEMKTQPGSLRFIAFSPDQAREQGTAISDFDSLAAHPELLIVSGMFDTNSQGVSVDPVSHRRAA
jgi:hypothetical protein